MPNKYYCSNGERVSQDTINRLRSKAYRDKYEGEPPQHCFECNGPATGSAHIIPQSACKSAHKSELIWYWENFVPSCNLCNSLIENVSSPEFKKLNGYEYYLEIFKEHDHERYLKAL